MEYMEPTKQIVREKTLLKAVKDLTTDRSSSYILDSDEVFQTLEFAKYHLAKYNKTIKQKNLNQQADRRFTEWSDGILQKTEIKISENLKVLYLCGPNPSNDLKILLSRSRDQVFTYGR